MYNEVPSSNQFTPMNPIQTFIKALTKPNEQAYREIVNDPGASVGKGILWFAVAGFISGTISGLINWLFGTSTLSQLSQYTDYDIPIRAGGSFLGMIGSAFSGLFGAIIGALIVVGLVQLVAKMLGGIGTFQKLFYGYAAAQAPLGMVTAILGSIPFLGCLALPLGIYGIVLNVIANKAANEYDTGKAVISTLAPIIVITLFCCCIIAIVGAIGGLAFGDIFQSLQ